MEESAACFLGVPLPTLGEAWLRTFVSPGHFRLGQDPIESSALLSECPVDVSKGPLVNSVGDHVQESAKPLGFDVNKSLFPL